MKYARIALHETAGHRLDEANENSHNRHDLRSPPLDIDPSFPRIPATTPVELPNWLEHVPDDDGQWLSSGMIKIPSEFLRPIRLFDCDQLEGPWLSIDGFFEMRSEKLKRSMYAFVRGYVVSNADVDGFVESIYSKSYLGNTYLPEEPTDYYTFVGEAPWSDHFAAGDEDEEADDLYYGKVNGMSVELLSHSIDWASHRSPANDSLGCSVPSKLFSSRFNLLTDASNWAYYDEHGKVATLTLSPPGNCREGGNILFMREDLVREYCESSDSTLVVVCWGERNLTSRPAPFDEQYQSIYSQYGHVWRSVFRPFA